MSSAFLRAFGVDASSVPHPDPASVWRAFVAFASTPVDASRDAAGTTEDFLMFDPTGARDATPVLRLVRTIGLADADGDYVDSRPFECYLFYEAQAVGDGVPVDSIWASSPPEAPLSQVEQFVRTVEASNAFDALIRRGRPRLLEVGA